MRFLWSILCLVAFAGAQTGALTGVVQEPMDTVPLADTVNTDSLDLLTEVREGPDTVEYSAVDLQYDFPTQTFNLNNKALIKYRGISLTGDTIWFDQGKQVLQASGHPVLKDPRNPPLSGFRMKYNMNNKIGQVFYGSSFRDNQRFNGMDIRRLPDTRLQLSRGDFSTCNDSTHQHYYFYSRRMVVTPKENVVAAPVVLNIEDVPVAVLPLLVSPLKTGKRSGLLSPKFGGDQQQGFYLTNIGVYWAISDYMDATLSGDIIEGSAARFEKSSLRGAYNYKKMYVLDGNITGQAYLNEFNLGNSGWDIHFKHQQNLRPDEKSVLSGEGSFVSKNTIRKDNSLVDTVVLSQEANANMTWLRSFSNGKRLTVRMNQNHNLNTDSVVREIPDISFSASGPLYWDRLNYSFSNRSNLLQTRFPDSIHGGDSTKQWLGNSSAFTVDWTGQLLNVFSITPRYTANADWSALRYEHPEDSLSKDPSWNLRPEAETYGEFFAKHSFGISMNTKLFGIWRPEWGRFFGVRHIITPTVSYTFSPEMDSNAHFVPHPRLSQSYYQSKSKSVGFGLGNAFDLKYLTVKDSGRADGTQNLRILNVNSNTSYDFAKDSLQWSTIRSTVGIQVIPEYLFTIDMDHDVYHRFSEDPNRVRVPELISWGYGLSKSFSFQGRVNSGILVGPGDEPDMLKWSLGGNYGYTFRSKRVGLDLFQDDITHSSSLSATLEPSPKWSMQYATSYDYNRGEFSRHQFTFKRDLHCWDMTFTWTPVGTLPGWSFVILIRELPDIKLQAGSTKS